MQEFSDSSHRQNTTPAPRVQRSRSKKQGWSSRNRKALFWLYGPVLIGYLFFVRDPFPVSVALEMCLQLAGSLLVFAGCLGRLLATLTIGGHKSKTVVRTELYSICRNPLYFSSFLLALGLGLLTCRLDFTVLLAGAYFAIFLPMMWEETRYLRHKFPDFSGYETEVPLFFPRLALWTARNQFEINFQMLGKTCTDAAVVVILIPVIILARWLIVT